MKDSGNIIIRSHLVIKDKETGEIIVNKNDSTGKSIKMGFNKIINTNKPENDENESN
jgi:hypothetical protein